MRPGITIGLLTLMTALGCGDDEQPEMPSEAAAQRYMGDRSGPSDRPRADDVANSMPAITRVTPSDAPRIRTAEAGGGGGGGGRYPGMPRGRVMDEDEARDVSNRVASANLEGNTHCQRAWQALLMINEAYREATPEAQRNWPRGRPNRRHFMEGCMLKPESMQQCMVPSYLRSHSEECERVAREWHREMELPEGTAELLEAERANDERQGRASSVLDRENREAEEEGFAAPNPTEDEVEEEEREREFLDEDE